ncbi:OsmC family protein [Acidicapsa acidisoli]|uniref:OsmC family protein n=1 Tax=Acidicapsa acidisoli TaxID=1615681 RepID=UPI0021E0463C|nr:OsmC family protein [Acidicapsa acidisoli]
MIARTEWASTEPSPDIYVGHSQSGHTIRLDATKEHSEGPSPMEVVLVALCGCTSVDVVHILQKKRQPLAHLTVSATAEQRTEPPNYFNKIQLVYAVTPEAGGQLSRKAVEDAVALSKDKYCSVSAMLEKSAEIEFVIEYVGGEPLP